MATSIHKKTQSSKSVIPIKILGLPIGQATAGYLLVKQPLFDTGEIRNYTIIFIIALVIQVVGLIWIVSMIDENVVRKQEMKIEMKIRGIRGPVLEGESKITLKSEMSRDDKNIHPLRLLFDLENVRQMARTALKKRPNNVRRQLFFLFCRMFMFIMHISGTAQLQAPFTQKVYLWNPDWASYMNALSLVVHGIATITIVPILIRVFKVGDIPLSIIGFCLLFSIDVIKGSWLSANAYYSSIPAGAIAGMCGVGLRSYLTKIVDRDEIGKIVSFMSTLDTLAPIISSAFLVYIFKLTIDTYPGTVFQVIALLILIPILMLIWIDLYTDRPFMKRPDENQDDPIHVNNDTGNKKLKPKRQTSRIGRNYEKFNLNHEIIINGNIQNSYKFTGFDF